MDVVRDNPEHRVRILSCANNVDHFSHFTNLLMNDTGYLLEEGMTSIHKIHDIEHEMSDSQAWLRLSGPERRERESVLRTAESQAGFTLAYGTGAIQTIAQLSLSAAAAFTIPEIVDRLANMLNYNVKAMVGPDSSRLKVQTPKKVLFAQPISQEV